ncbi:accessory gene regulator B family protein [Clostridium boliviensis]|uniref:Accessory gene regulator B family protein n=1 Tax=Clostridium boliviensis TaxID=318465 RepID=A0ABU4GL81_9CLOT|nr:accessory gene regulator B family protein [Clostridium boliviensis]MDW2797745.1 accessory gene regulator B family protein [Clostridium boliviensis]
MPVRTYAGGLHMTNFWSCFLLSCLIQVGVLMLFEMVCIPLVVSWLLIAISMIMLLVIAPVPTINRQIDDLESRYMSKKLKLVFILIILLNMILTYLSYVNYLSLIAITMIVVLFSAIAGKIKYYYELSKNKI